MCLCVRCATGHSCSPPGHLLGAVRFLKFVGDGSVVCRIVSGMDALDDGGRTHNCAQFTRREVLGVKLNLPPAR